MIRFYSTLLPALLGGVACSTPKKQSIGGFKIQEPSPGQQESPNESEVLQRGHMRQQMEIAALKLKVSSLEVRLNSLENKLRTGVSFSEDTVEEIYNREWEKTQKSKGGEEIENLSSGAQAIELDVKKGIVKHSDQKKISRELKHIETLYERGFYGQVIVNVQKLIKEYPKVDDDGLALLLEAKSWLKLKEPHHSFPLIRRIYLNHPNSEHLREVKLTEGLLLESQASYASARKIFREIISLAPKSPESDRARSALTRMEGRR